MINRKAFLQKRFSIGFVREKENYPLYIDKCLNKKLIDYKIYGNSIQSGIGTPTNPIPVKNLGDSEYINFSNNGEITIINIEGHEPLMKIGEYTDYIDYENSRIVRNIRRKKIKDLVFSSAILGTFNRFEISKSFEDKLFTGTASENLKCDVFKVEKYTPMTDNSIAERTNMNRIRISTSLYSTVDAIKEAVGEYYVYYVLATPKYETIDLPDLRLETMGNNIIAYDGDVNASKISCKYRSKSKEKVGENDGR